MSSSSSIIKTLKDRREALRNECKAIIETAERSHRAMNTSESALFDAKLAEQESLKARIDELTEQRDAEDATASFYSQNQTRGSAGGFGQAVYTNPREQYGNTNDSPSFFRDLISAKDGKLDAIERLGANNARRGVEARALGSASGSAGSQFAPPAWVVDEFVKLARPARVTADLCFKQELPGGVSSINLPKITSGTTTAVQATQNNAVSNTDMTTNSVTSGITTIAGQQVVSVQLIAQSPIPFDQVVLGDLAADYAKQIDIQIINGSGASGQLRGILQGSGITTTTYTSATPKVVSTTAADSFYNKLVSALTSVHLGVYKPATAIIMHPNRWGWVLEALDSQTRPLLTPDGPMYNGIGTADPYPVAQGAAGSLLGVPCYLDPNIPTNLGAGTNQDPVFVVRAPEMYLWETAMQAASFEATYAYNASILYRVLGFAAFIPDRLGAAVSVINGTGLVGVVL